MACPQARRHLGLQDKGTSREEMRMHVEEGNWGWLREKPPGWPRREPERDQPQRQRWLREPEPYEDHGIFEPYPGAMVLEDLPESGEEGASLRILARYTVIRTLQLSTAGVLEGRALRTERRSALAHLALLPKHDWERQRLERLTRLCEDEPLPEVVDAALIAAECAAKRSQRMGAFALYRAGFEVAMARGWWGNAARCAGGIARLARLDELPVSARVWTWRRRVLEARARAAAERALARAAEDADAPAPPAGDHAG
jgi:hypothetical protein